MRDGRRAGVGKFFLVMAVAAGLATTAAGQQPPKAGAPTFKGPLPPPKAGPPPQARPLPAKTTAKGTKVPEPEDVPLRTRDGVDLKATYYAAAVASGTSKKETVPIILVHGLDGQRGEFHGLALHLQERGHAVLVPDLRGHGQSKTQTLPNGAKVSIDADKLKKPALEDMVLDIEECKKFLLTKNNAGELNIEQLCVVGSEFGGILAVLWSRSDWSWPTLPSHKQGQDVKALVLLSPVASVKGVTMRDALSFPPLQSQLSFMLIAGSKDTKSAAEAKKLHKELQSHRPKVPEDSEDRARLLDVFLIQPDTSLAGAKLLASVPSVTQNIARFIELRLVNRKDEFKWQDRTGPGK